MTPLRSVQQTDKRWQYSGSWQQQRDCGLSFRCSRRWQTAVLMYSSHINLVCYIHLINLPAFCSNKMYQTQIKCMLLLCRIFKKNMCLNGFLNSAVFWTNEIKYEISAELKAIYHLVPLAVHHNTLIKQSRKNKSNWETLWTRSLLFRKSWIYQILSKIERLVPWYLYFSVWTLADPDMLNYSCPHE